MQSEDLRPGQRWTYRTRPGERESTLVITAIDADARLGNIVHVRIDDVRLKTKHSRTGEATCIGHAPIAEEAILPELVECVEHDVEIGDKGGYGIWREGFDRGDAGIWTHAPAEVVHMIEEAMSR